MQLVGIKTAHFQNAIRPAISELMMGFPITQGGRGALPWDILTQTGTSHACAGSAEPYGLRER